MAYARLTFSTSAPPAGQVLKVIAQVLTGESNIANLGNVGSFYTPTGVVTSEIVGNTVADSWTLAFPASLPGAGNNQVSTFTVSAPCVTSGKNKFVRFIGATSAGVYFEPTYGNGTVFSSTVSYSIYAQGLSSIDAGGNATNLTWRNSNGTQATVVKGTATLAQLYSIEMSWSKRHLFITSSINKNCYFAAMEFPETLLTNLYANCAPVLYMTGPVTSTLSNLTVNSTAAAHVQNIVNTFNPVNGTFQGIRALVPASISTAMVTSDTTYNSVDIRYLKIRDSLSGRWPLVPLIQDDLVHGNGYLNLTQLSNIVLSPNDSTTNGNLYTGSNGITYKGIDLYDNTYAAKTVVLVRYG